MISFWVASVASSAVVVGYKSPMILHCLIVLQQIQLIVSSEKDVLRWERAFCTVVSVTCLSSSPVLALMYLISVVRLQNADLKSPNKVERCDCATGGWLHCTCGCSGGQEAGADQGGEARPQLHDGHATLQTGTSLACDCSVQRGSRSGLLSLQAATGWLTLTFLHEPVQALREHHSPNLFRRWRTQLPMYSGKHGSSTNTPSWSRR